MVFVCRTLILCNNTQLISEFSYMFEILHILKSKDVPRSSVRNVIAS